MQLWQYLPWLPWATKNNAGIPSIVFGCLRKHRILPYLYVNILFKCHSIGSGFTKLNYSFNCRKIHQKSITICPIFEQIFPVLNE
jgi:hypothetical protein